MSTKARKKPLGHRVCAFSGCKTLFLPVRKTQRFHTAACRFAAWMESHDRAIVTKLKFDEQTAPTIWHAVTSESDQLPLALFRNVSEAIEYGKTHCKAKFQTRRVDLSDALTKSRH